MLKISEISNIMPGSIRKTNDIKKDTFANYNATNPQNYSKYTSENLKAYIPSFSATKNKKNNNIPSKHEQIKNVKSKLEKESLAVFNKLQKSGILDNNESNDGSSVLDNLYKIAAEARFPGLSSSQIIKDVLKAIDNPFTITQKFGDIPEEVASEYKEKTGKLLPRSVINVNSSCCVVASIEFNLAQKKPAEFARFAQGLSSNNYQVEKNVKMSNLANGSITGALWELRTFNTDSKINTNWEDITINIKPDRNAIVRARVQSSYKDPGERSVVDVLIQSALLNLGSQHTYNTLTDERTGKLNPDKTGLTSQEKNFVEEIVFEIPKISVEYQQINEDGYLIGYNGKLEETKQHILKSLAMGENVIIGYTHMDTNKKIDGGHEITIIGYEQDKAGNGYFICNDTDDNLDKAVKIDEETLLPLIHHAGIPKEALSENDYFDEAPWRKLLKDLKAA